MLTASGPGSTDVRRSRSIAVVGAGGWGTALAIHLARRGHAVRLWVREADLLARMLERRDNPPYLPGVTLPESVLPVGRVREALEEAEIVVTAVPSGFAGDVYRTMAPHLEPGVPVVLATKGIEEGTLALPLEVAERECGGPERLAILSGPSFAPEVARGLPTAVVVAGRERSLITGLQALLSTRELRLYTNRDAVGVQVAGALKNVMAIAAGVEEGLGMGTNGRAALITRGLAEITRLGLALGARAETFSGLAGLGDLVLTCTGDLSRNISVGRRLGRGERLEDILSGTRAIAEGVRTTLAARELARRAGVDMPIVEEVYRILYEDGALQEGLDRLLGRPLTSEDGDAPPREGGA